jgi:hypothetical protein
LDVRKLATIPNKMTEVEYNLDKITNFWNDYVWNYKFIQGKVLWNEEVKTNYYGDILKYFLDTFELLKTNDSNNDFNQYIFHSVGLMQIIYVHQDLTDELLKIFKESQSTKADKNPNREIRNELIGHPISRNLDKSFKSSIFWSNNLSSSNIEYIKYDKNNNFEGKTQSYSTSEILKRHNEYLVKYLEKIVRKNKKVLNQYLKKVKQLGEMIESKIEFGKLVDFTYSTFETIMNNSYVYKVEYLKKCKIRENDHIRYKLVIESFITDLKNHLQETESNIKEFTESNYEPESKKRNEIPENIKIVFTDSSGGAETKIAKKSYRYEISKLYSKKHLKYDLDYFKKCLKDDDILYQELLNMEINYHNDLEYYSSLRYIEKTLIIKGLY